MLARLSSRLTRSVARRSKSMVTSQRRHMTNVPATVSESNAATHANAVYASKPRKPVWLVRLTSFVAGGAAVLLFNQFSGDAELARLHGALLDGVNDVRAEFTEADLQHKARVGKLERRVADLEQALQEAAKGN